MLNSFGGKHPLEHLLGQTITNVFSYRDDWSKKLFDHGSACFRPSVSCDSFDIEPNSVRRF